MYGVSMYLPGLSSFELEASGQNSQFNPIRSIPNSVFKSRNNEFEGNGRPVTGQSRQVKNAITLDYASQVPITTQPINTGMGLGTQANTTLPPNIGQNQSPQVMPRDQIVELIQEVCGL